MNRRPRPVLVLLTALIPLAVTAGGTFLVMHAGPRVIEGLSARSWPTVPGRVVDARVEEVDLGGRGPGTKRWFEVRVTYVFDVAGRSHRGDRVGFWPERRLSPQAREFAASYPPGHPVRVYYDPSNPARSVLDRSIGAGTWAMAGAGVLLLVLGLVMLIGFARGLHRGGFVCYW